MNLAPEIEKLDPATWIAAADRIRGVLEASEFQDMERLLRRTYHLAQLAPLPSVLVADRLIDENAFEASLESGEYHEAAMRLLGDRSKSEFALTGPDCAWSQLSRVAEIDEAARSDTWTITLLDAWLEYRINLIALMKSNASVPRPRLRLIASH